MALHSQSHFQLHSSRLEKTSCFVSLRCTFVRVKKIQLTSCWSLAALLEFSRKNLLRKFRKKNLELCRFLTSYLICSFRPEDCKHLRWRSILLGSTEIVWMFVHFCPHIWIEWGAESMFWLRSSWWTVILQLLPSLRLTVPLAM